MKKEKKSVCVDIEKNNGIENDEIRGNEEDNTPSSSPFSCLSSSSSTSCNSGFPYKKTKIIREIYEASRRVLDEDLINFALFADADPINFEETF